MTGTEIVCYQSLEDITGVRSSEDQLIKDLSRFSRDSVLWVCSYISVTLRLWDRKGYEVSDYYKLLDHFYSPEFSLKLKLAYFSSEESRRLVFHRRQLLYVAKLAIKHCQTSGIIAGDPRNAFGITLLAANDHLHYNIIPDGPLEKYERKDYAKFLAELLVSTEYSIHLGSEPVVRASTMFSKIAPQLKDHPDFIDLNQSFIESAGMSYKQFFAFTVGVTSRYINSKKLDLDRNSRNLATPSDYLSQLRMPAEVIARFFSLVTASPERLANKISNQSNDLTVFRQYPLMHVWFDVCTTKARLGFLLMDMEFMMDKLYTAPFWLFFGKHKTRFTRFWGGVFEEYVSALVERAIPGDCSTRFFRNPKNPKDPSEELCDGLLICGDSLVLLEYKASLVRGDVKYSGNPDKLSLHLQDKFVRDRVSKRPKAVAQLANAVRSLFTADQASLDWLDLSSIKTCYLLIISLDSIGSAIGMAPFLETFLKEEIDREAFINLNIRPIFCLDVEGIEHIAPSLSHVSLAQILERWYRTNPSLFTPIAGIDMKNWVTTRSEETWTDYTNLMDEVIEHFFGQELVQKAREERKKRA